MISHTAVNLRKRQRTHRVNSAPLRSCAIAPTVSRIKAPRSSGRQREPPVIPVLIPPPDTPARVGRTHSLKQFLLQSNKWDVEALFAWMIPASARESLLKLFLPTLHPKEIKSHYSNKRFKCGSAIPSCALEAGLL